MPADDALQSGDSVRHPKMPGWGVGKVKSVRWPKVTVYFPDLDAEKQVRVDLCPLERIRQKRTASPKQSIEKILPALQLALKDANDRVPEDGLTARISGAKPQAIIEALKLSIGGHAKRGWRLGPTFDEAANAVVDRFWRKTHKRNLRLFVSYDESLCRIECSNKPPRFPFYTFVYLLQDVTVEEVAEFALIGTTNSPEDRWKRTQTEIRACLLFWDFEIVIARPDYFEGRFIVPMKGRRLAKQFFERMPCGGFDVTHEDSVSPTGFHVGWD